MTPENRLKNDIRRKEMQAFFDKVNVRNYMNTEV